jgi:ABC-type sugar transport system ATPase subunit
MRGEDKAAIQSKVARAVEVLQLEPYLARKPGELSGGQCQRVAIGRALVQQPEVFLFDEPLSNLDAELRLRMRVEIAALHRRLGKTMIYVTHDQVEAMTLADRIVVLRDGRIVQVGSPMSLYSDPCNEFVAGFIGAPAINRLAATLTGVDAGGTATATLADGTVWRFTVRADAALQAGMALSLGVRPEHLLPGEQAGLSGELELVERLGAQCYAHVSWNGQRLCASVAPDVALVAGQTVSLSPKAGWIYAFDSSGAVVSAAKPFLGQ